VLEHPDIYVAGDLASVVDPRSGHVLPPLAQVALEEGETVARNLEAELRGRRLESSPSTTRGSSSRSGSAAVSPTSLASPAAGSWPHLLKDAIEWEYRQSVRHLRGWDPIAG
jgi:NADH dehydrogenase